MSKTVDLIHLKTNQSGMVVRLDGGHEFRRKIESLGIRKGKKITKKSAHFWKGPQTVKVGNMTVAIGHGMASKIFIEVQK